MAFPMNENSNLAWGALKQMTLGQKEVLKAIYRNEVNVAPIVDVVNEYGLNGLENGIALVLASEHGKPLSTCDLLISNPDEDAKYDDEPVYMIRDAVLVQEKQYGGLLVYSPIDDETFFIASGHDMEGTPIQEVADRIVRVHCTFGANKIDRYIYQQGDIEVFMHDKMRHPFSK